MGEKTGKEYEMMKEWVLVANAKFYYKEFLKSVMSDNVEKLNDNLRHTYKILDDVVLKSKASDFQKKLLPGEQYYRARIIRAADYDKPETGIGISEGGLFAGYNEDNSREPILGFAGHGRNNVAGVSYLYIASDPRTACMEVKSQFGDLISLATFETASELNIIDFSTDKSFEREFSELHNLSMGHFFTYLMSNYFLPVKNDQEYRVTQHISDYLRKTGIDGIAYQSKLSPGGINYTIFNSHHSKIKFCHSKILLHKQANHSFWDWNEEKTIFSNPEGVMMNYDTEIANRQKEILKATFKTVLPYNDKS